MTIAVELLLVFMLPHLFTAFLDHASHDLASFLYLTNPQLRWSEFSAHREVPGVW